MAEIEATNCDESEVIETLKTEDEFTDGCSSSDYSDNEKEILNDDDMCRSFQNELHNLPDVLQCINNLRSYIRRQEDKIQRLLVKLKRKNYRHKSAKRLADASAQTDFDCDELEKLDAEWKAGNETEKLNGVWEGEEETSTVAEQVKQAAENALQQTGFVYEETSGMYYDYNTGYYYNAELGLYYDGNSGTYYYYDEESNSFKYHSQIEQKPPEVPVKQIKKRERRQKKERRKRKAEDMLEEGECSDTTDDSGDASSPELSDSDNSSEQAAAWPPCMRIIVKETTIPKLKVGTLFIVPYTGGTVGREGDHAFCLADVNISKSHMKLEFAKEEGKFYVEDLGSRNGTLLNGQAVVAGPAGRQEVVHGSTLQLATTKLLCHIHCGRDTTCGHCEPGLVQRSDAPADAEDKTVASTAAGSLGSQFRQEMKRIRRKFALESAEPNLSAVSSSGYEDRAQLRRETIGSQNPYEKTQTASINEPIPAQNKGFQLLEKMGWSQGQPLGKDGDGCTEPETHKALHDGQKCLFQYCSQM